MPLTLKSSTSQQKRWERGRFDLARAEAWPLIHGFLRTGDSARLDVAIELALPPLSLVVSAVVCCCALAGALHWGPALWLALGLVLALGLHVAAGAALARLSVRAYLSLLSAPLYVVWKCWVYAAALASHGSLPWVRTQRASVK
jgi:hypothetical protein